MMGYDGTKAYKYVVKSPLQTLISFSYHPIACEAKVKIKSRALEVEDEQPHTQGVHPPWRQVRIRYYFLQWFDMSSWV